ncbi:MAG: T9SS type A sorting domain-containing protein [Bacteroidetes bacterium]|nr:MAG: T9SS type A sorting domain-containing protein [Bacteroidota bacterium]
MKQLIALLTLFSVFSVFSQNCGNCTSTYSTSTTINLNVLAGETFCIDAGVTITGDVIVNGGTLCNNGTITGNLSIYSGNVYNYGMIDLTSGLNHTSGDLFNYGSLINGSYLGIGTSISTINFGSMNITTLNYGNAGIGPNAVFNNFGFIQATSISVDTTDFLNSGTINLTGNLNNGNQSTFNNQGELTIGGNLVNNQSALFKTSCTIPVGNNFSNYGNIEGPFVGCGGFEVTGNATNFATGTIALNNSNIDVCEAGIPGGLANFGVVGSNVTQCSCNTTCSAQPSNGIVQVFNDLNQNCSVDLGEYGISNVYLTLAPNNEIITTNAAGYAFLNSLTDGTYTLTVDTTNLNWHTDCPTSISFDVTGGVFSSNLYFGLISDNPCSSPDVSIYMPFIRGCNDNQMVYVSACNEWTATDQLSASYVDVELPSELTLNSATLSYTDLGNNVFRFSTGDILPGECVTFVLSTTVECGLQIGQTLCLSANLNPVLTCMLDTVPSNPITGNGTTTTNTIGLNGFPQPCTLPWDQSSLSVDGWCANDSIYFTITNTGSPGGGDMECYSPMWITIDGVLTYSDSIMIPGGETITLVFPGDGQTWQLNASQHPLHPGNSNPNAVVEACGSDLTNWEPGIVDDLPSDDADPVVDIFCGPVLNSYDPNDKTGFPNGITEEHYIQPGQQLQYAVRFQNTGNDVAYNIIIRDTLDTDLNIFTVTPGVASHPYTFRIYGPRVLEWTFENINLPDSTSNEPESHGFVTYHVEQAPGLTPGTQITNHADIYFDFNDPIITNETWHKIYEGFPAVASINEFIHPTTNILIYPNPTNETITIKQDDMIIRDYMIFDIQGKMILSGTLSEKMTDVSLINCSKGIYLIKIDGIAEPIRIVRN